MWSAVFIPNRLTRDIVEKYHKRMFREFYIRPKIILSHLKRIRKWETFYGLYKGMRGLLKATFKI